MAVALAGQLREGTKKSHTMAENTGFVACFLKGVVEKKSYRKLISDLYFVYEAMEEEIERLVYEEHPVIKPIGFKSLFRKETLENDNNCRVPKLLGIVMRGMIVPSERWRVATIGDWEMTGTHLPQKEQKDNLFLVCKELYKLFSTTSAGNKN